MSRIDFPIDIGVFVLSDEFHAKEVDEHQVDGARNLKNTEEMLEGHQRMNMGIVHVKKSPRFSNIADKSRGQGKDLDASARVSVQKAPVQNKVVELGGHARVQQTENLHHVSTKREAIFRRVSNKSESAEELGGQW
uniref:Uncharacterized protein n=1 Tax=Oryza meridionalis TaxID=40149 RepID=A0A0E0EJS2_9ORYZ